MATRAAVEPEPRAMPPLVDARPAPARTLELSSALARALDIVRSERSGAALADARRELLAHPPRLSADVLSAHRVPGGSGVSYGHTYRTTVLTTLADVSIGYGHGVPRAAGNVLTGHWRSVDGQVVALPIVGRVAMDDLIVDAGDLPVTPGDRIVLFGDPANGQTDAATWAARIGEDAISLLCALDSRVLRVVL